MHTSNPNSLTLSLTPKMAAKSFSLLTITLSLSFFFFISSVLSRSSSAEDPHTTLLDVTSSIQKTIDVLSFNPETLKTLHQQEQTIPSSSSSSFSVPIYSRSTVYDTTQQHKDYRSLILSRLERDSDRVKSLTMKLEFALNDVKRSDLMPMASDTQMILPEDLQTPIISGVSLGSGEYFSRVQIGSPPKPMYLVIDTGSDISWIQCNPCSDCYQQSDPIFDPSASSSYTSLACDAEQCKSLDVSACRAGKCLYQVSYGDGSYTVGDFVTETMSFGSSGSVPNLALGCGHDNTGLFVGSAGLLGLGAGKLSLPTQIKATSFSYCLVNRDSDKSSTLEFNSGRPGDAVTAPITRNKKIDTFLYVGLTGISVAGESLSIPPSLFQVDESGTGGIIVDSGTAVTRLRTEAYNSLRDAFRKYTKNLPTATGLALFDTCYDLSSRTTVSVPTVMFNFAGGKSLKLPAANYLIPVDSHGTFCLAFAPTASSLSIIGNVQQQGIRVSFDIANSVVGFSPSKC